MDLLIDDVRSMPYGIIARDYESGLKMLRMGGFDCLYLDHDLGEIKTGYDLIKQAVEEGIELPDKIAIVSSNPVGRDNIKRLLMYDCDYREKGAALIKWKPKGE